MKKIILIIILCNLLLLTLSGSFCETNTKLLNLDIELTINPDLTINTLITTKVYNNSTKVSKYFYLFVSDQPDEIVIVDEQGNNINFTKYRVNNGLSIKIEDIIKSNESKIYTLTYLSKGLIQKYKNNFLFSYNYKSAYELPNFNLKLILPKGYGTTSEVLDPISPPTSRLFSNGQQIMIEWDNGLHYLETNSYSVFFEKINVISFSLIIGIIFFILGSIFGGIILYFFMKKNNKGFVAMALSIDEKKVLDFIIEVGNKAFQKDIGKAIDFSKPKLSKIITQLKNKKIIFSKRDGRKNLIIINNKIL